MALKPNIILAVNYSGSLNCIKLKGKYTRELNKIRKKDILIIDDFGLEMLDAFNRLALLEILEDRHDRSSAVIVSPIFYSFKN